MTRTTLTLHIPRQRAMKYAKRFVFLVSLSLPVPAQGAPRASKDVQRTSVKVVTAEKTTLESFIDWEGTSHKRNRVHLNHPHTVANPDGRVQEFEGMELASIFADLTLSPGSLEKPTSDVHFVGRDGYTISIPLADALSARAMILSHRAGQRMPWKLGAPFLSFPNLESPKLSYLKASSWWAWWVSMIVVGDPKPRLRFADRTEKFVDFSKCTGKGTRELSYPRGRRLIEQQKNTRSELSWCTLREVGAQLGIEHNTKLDLVFDTGTELENVGVDDAIVVYAHQGGKRIPTTLGGPLQLCFVDSKKECRYFVSEVRGAKP